MAEISNLDDVFIVMLRRAYDAEKRLTKALPKLAKSASSPELKQAFADHLRETETHVERVEQIFDFFGQPPTAETADSVKGIVKAGDDVIKLRGDGPVKDAALIAAAQQAEHYEIAVYGTLRTWAAVLGRPDAASLLELTLSDEKKTDQKLTDIANALNTQAAIAGP